MWHFYEGSPIKIYMLDEQDEYYERKLGNPLIHGDDVTFQLLIPRNTWFAANVQAEDGFGFVGCTVAPGFDFAAFQLANRKELIEQYPDHKNIITTFTRQKESEESSS